MVESPPFGRLTKGISPRLDILRHTQVKQIISLQLQLNFKNIDFY